MSGVGTGHTEGSESFRVALLVGDLARCLRRVGFGKRDRCAGGSSLEILSLKNSQDQSQLWTRKTRKTYGRVALLGLTSLAGEDDETGLVGVQPLNIELLALLAKVSSPVVNNDTNSASLLPSNSSLLELSEGEAATFPEFTVVADGLSTDSWAERLSRANSKGSGFGLAGSAAAKFASWLVEPGTDSALPVLAEVVGVKD